MRLGRLAAHRRLLDRGGLDQLDAVDCSLSSPHSAWLQQRLETAFFTKTTCWTSSARPGRAFYRRPREPIFGLFIGPTAALTVCRGSQRDRVDRRNRLSARPFEAKRGSLVAKLSMADSPGNRSTTTAVSTSSWPVGKRSAWPSRQRQGTFPHTGAGKVAAWRYRCRGESRESEHPSQQRSCFCSDSRCPDAQRNRSTCRDLRSVSRSLRRGLRYLPISVLAGREPQYEPPPRVRR